VISQNSQFSMGIKMGGITLSEYLHEDEVFVHGPKGETFAISLMNNSSRRAVAVVSMDGLCIIDGLEMLEQGLGYILEPGKQITVDCWRFKGSQCPELQFGYRPPGFENIMDEPANPGVIEAIFFYEQEDPQYSSNWLAQSGFRIEEHNPSGWGSTRKLQVIREQFAREEQDAGKLVIQYEERDALEKMGIQPR